MSKSLFSFTPKIQYIFPNLVTYIGGEGRFIRTFERSESNKMLSEGVMISKLPNSKYETAKKIVRDFIQQSGIYIQNITEDDWDDMKTIFFNGSHNGTIIHINIYTPKKTKETLVRMFKKYDK